MEAQGININGKAAKRITLGGNVLWEANAGEYELLEYIASNGAQYIDTGLYNSSELEVALKFLWTGNDIRQGHLIGSADHYQSQGFELGICGNGTSDSWWKNGLGYSLTNYIMRKDAIGQIYAKGTTATWAASEFTASSVVNNPSYVKSPHSLIVMGWARPAAPDRFKG